MVRVIRCAAAVLLVSMILQMRLGTAQEAPPPEVKAKATYLFADRIGVNVRLGLANSPYQKYDAIVKPRLLELNVKVVREAMPIAGLDTLNKLKDLGAAGIKSCVIVKNNTALDVCKAISKSIYSLEIDASDRAPNWEATVRDDQRNLFETIKRNAKYKSLTVILPGLSDPWHSPEKLGDLKQYTELGSFHCYPLQDEAAKRVAVRYLLRDLALEEYKVSGPESGNWVTELGFHNGPDIPGHPGVPEEIAAKYLARSLLSTISIGFGEAIVYELLDQEPATKMTTGDKHFGLLRVDGTPKPAFLALKKFLAFMKDPGPLITPDSLAYKVDGAPDYLEHLLLQKRDGRFFLLLWIDVPCYDPKTKREWPVAPKQVTVTVGTPLEKAQAWHLLRDDDTPRPLTELKQMKVSVSEDILVIELTKKR